MVATGAFASLIVSATDEEKVRAVPNRVIEDNVVSNIVPSNGYLVTREAGEQIYQAAELQPLHYRYISSYIHLAEFDHLQHDSTPSMENTGPARNHDAIIERSFAGMGGIRHRTTVGNLPGSPYR